MLMFIFLFWILFSAFPLFYDYLTYLHCNRARYLLRLCWGLPSTRRLPLLSTLLDLAHLDRLLFENQEYPSEINCLPMLELLWHTSSLSRYSFSCWVWGRIDLYWPFHPWINKALGELHVITSIKSRRTISSPYPPNITLHETFISTLRIFPPRCCFLCFGFWLFFVGKLRIEVPDCVRWLDRQRGLSRVCQGAAWLLLPCAGRTQQLRR